MTISTQRAQAFLNFNPNPPAAVLAVMSRRQRIKHEEKLAAYTAEWELIRHIDNKTHDGLTVTDIPEVGRSVFTTRVFHKGTYVAVYGGEVQSVKQTKNEEKAQAAGHAYTFFCRDNEGAFVIDAKNESPTTSAVGCFINHSSDPAAINVVPGLHPLCGRKLYFTATQDIEANVELRYDYGERRPEIVMELPWLDPTKASNSHNDFKFWIYDS